jgi:hypothetical protein
MFIQYYSFSFTGSVVKSTQQPVDNQGIGMGLQAHASEAFHT